MPDTHGAWLHEDPDLFREAVGYTAARTGYLPRLIEQDYFCTLLLHYLSAGESDLVFKGGTCLAKVHVDFYRMSEDLDFVLPMPENATRGDRSRRAAGLKKAVARISRRHPALHVSQPLTGASDSRQYGGVLAYTSALAGSSHSIKVEVGLREPVLRPTVQGAAHTILLNPISGEPFVEPVMVRCLSLLECFAEKFRAALCRRDVAIRDFFDIDYAIHRRGVVAVDSELVDMIRRKVAVHGNDPPALSPERMAGLIRQVETQLKPVLKEADLAAFDLERVISTVSSVNGSLG